MTYLDPPTNPPVNGRKDFWTFDMVEERLVEAMELWRRAPDRERAWQHIRAYWPEVLRRPGRLVVDGEHDEREEDKAEPRPLPLTRAEVAEMNAAGELLQLAPERDRRLVAIVLAYRARGFDKVPWLRIWDRLGRGKPGPDGLRKRYTRSISDIAIALSR